MINLKKIKAIIFIIVAVMVLLPACHDDEEEEYSINVIKFNLTEAKMSVGQELSVQVEVNPQEARNSENITYSMSQSGFVELKQASNNGVVMKALQPGSVVLIAKAKNVTSYLEVKIEGGNFIFQPYILISQPVIEIKEGATQVISVSLFGGSALDNHTFQWVLQGKEGGEEDCIEINSTGNTVVVKGLRRGSQKIVISHPMADYNSEILVFVSQSNEYAKYIYCEKNVIMLETDGQYKHITFSLYGGGEGDKSDFRYEVIEGHENISIVGNNNILNMKALKSGSSLIKVTHPIAEVAFEVRAICVSVKEPLITVDKTFVLLDIGKNVMIKADVENPKSVLALNEFSYEIEGNGQYYIDVTQTNNEFFIRGIKDGLAKIVISNLQTYYSREVLIYVRSEMMYSDDYFITTSQNVIQTQVGDSDINLTMLLVGGNPADANSFSWVVSDGTIIDVSAEHNGKVNYLARTAAVTEVYVATAIISPKRSGVSTITVSHPKSETTSSVLVKVYPKGTFGGVPVIVKTEGLLKILRNKDLTVTLEMVSGSVNDIGSIDWTSANNLIAGVDSNVHGITNLINGNTSGRTKLTIDGGNLKQAHESIVLVGTQEELDAASIIYVDSIYQNVASGQVVRIPVKSSSSVESSKYKVKVTDGSKLYAVMVESQLVIQGKEPGETDVLITHPSGQEEGITLHVRVEPSGLTIDKPYYITGPEIVGIVNGTQKIINVSLEGAPPVEEGKLEWRAEEAGVVTITANGTLAYITGTSVYRQTNIVVSHPKSQNSKTIIVYTAASEDELNNKVVLGVEKKNYLLVKEEEVFITLKTNAKDADKVKINWAQDDLNVISIDSNYDSAQVRAKGVGNAKITISHPDNIIPATIFISVIEASLSAKAISGPAMIELIIGESQIISVITRNLSDTEKGNIRWSIEDSAVASVQENGESAYISGLKRGVTYVNIEQAALGYKHRATLLCAATKAELASMYIMGVASTYNKMAIGEEKSITIEFGSNGFPENEKAKIEWEAGENGVVSVAGVVKNAQGKMVGKGAKAVIVAKAAGTGFVDVKSEASENDLRITFEVSGKEAVNISWEMRASENIKGIVVNESAQITIRIYDGGNEITSGYSLFNVEVQNEEVIGVNLAGNILNITAKPLNGQNTAQSIITVSHAQVVENLRILIYTANTQAQLDNMYPIAAEKKNYLLQIGESAEVRLITDTSKDAQNMNNIRWGISVGGIISSPQISGNKTAVFKGEKAGSTEILISYPNTSTVVEKVYITVVEKNNIDFMKKINTESIIGLIKGQERNTAVVTANFTGTEEAEIVWSSGNENIVTVTGNGKNAVIKAKETAPNNSEVYVTVSYGTWLKRHILVYVCNDETQVKAYKAMNMENQYVRIGKGETVILPMFYAPNKTQAETVWKDRYENDVVEYTVKENGGKIEVKGKNEGVAVLEARNAGRTNDNNPLVIYVEVSNDYINIPKDVEPVKYITAAKTVYLLNPQEAGKQLAINVSAIGMEPQEIKNIKWIKESTDSKIMMFPNGDSCIVMSGNGQSGTSVIKVTGGENTLEIRIILSTDAVIPGITYINFEDTVRIGYKEEKQLSITLIGANSYNANLFTAVSDNKNVTVSAVGGMIFFKGANSGQSKITISHPDAQFTKEVMAVVTTNEEGLIYLTTRDNFNVIKKGEYKTISVEMIGYDDPISANYKWEVGEESVTIIKVTGNGKTAVVEGLASGEGQTGKIKVTNIYAPEYPLYIYVRVSSLDLKPIYITTAQNIVSITEGSSMYVEVELVNGDVSGNSLFRWQNITDDIMNVISAGNRALIQGKRAGYGRIMVSHPECLFNYIEIAVVIEPDMSASGIYITTDSLLVDMKPNDPVKTIDVRLVGGNAEDVYGFKWEIYQYSSLERFEDGSSKVVIDITSGADRAYITAKNEGEAVIRVTHPRTSYRLDIKIDVKFNSKIEFTQRNVTIDMGDTLLVSVNAPSNQRVIYEVSDGKVASVSGTNKICIIEGIKAGNIILTARNITGTLSDEIMVRVNHVEVDNVGFIVTSSSYVQFNVNDINGATVKADVQGKTNTGGNFNEGNGSNSIKWKVVSGIGNIKFSNNRTDEFTGSEVVIRPVLAGDVEIQLTHPLLKAGYVKRFYVRVDASNTQFSLESAFIRMNLNDQATAKCIISGAAVKDYQKDVEWKKTLNPALITLNGQDELGNIFIVSGNQPGRAQIEVVYKGVTVRYLDIVIEEEKLLDVTAQVSVTKGGKREIEYIVKPENTDVIVSIDQGGFITYEHQKNTVTGRGKIIITGVEPGAVVMKLQTGSGHNLYRNVIINVTTKRDFYFTNSESIRVEPWNNKNNKANVVIVPYQVEPEMSNGVTITGADKIDNELWARNDDVKLAKLEKVAGKDEIRITTESSGHFRLRLTSAAATIEKDVYIYYEYIDFNFKLSAERITDSNYKVRSTIDLLNNVIRIADGEKVYIYPNTFDLNKYKGHNVFIETETGTFQIKDNKDSNILIDAYKSSISENQYCMRISFSKSLVIKPMGATSLLTSEYVGLLIFKYKYNNGEDENKEFTKSFMVYKETYTRNPNNDN